MRALNVNDVTDILLYIVLPILGAVALAFSLSYFIRGLIRVEYFQKLNELQIPSTLSLKATDYNLIFMFVGVLCFGPLIYMKLATTQEKLKADLQELGKTHDSLVNDHKLCPRLLTITLEGVSKRKDLPILNNSQLSVGVKENRTDYSMLLVPSDEGSQRPFIKILLNDRNAEKEFNSIYLKEISTRNGKILRKWIYNSKVHPWEEDAILMKIAP